MPAGLPVALTLFAQTASAGAAADPGRSVSGPIYGPAALAPPKPPVPVTTAARECASQNSDPKANEIVVCAVKPQGYRLPPDIVEARRLKKQGQGVGSRPHNPHETYADHSCATVGPMGCRGGPTINLLAAAATLAEMGDRLSKGQEVGSMFKTEPTLSEYQLYLEAKKRREAKESEAAAAAVKAKAAQAAKAAQPSQVPTQQTPPANQLKQ